MSIIKIQSTLIVSRVEIKTDKKKEPFDRRESTALPLRIMARFLRRDPEGLTRDRVLHIRRRLMARPARGGKRSQAGEGDGVKTPRARISRFSGIRGET